MEQKKHILIYAHYYYPDVASTGQILTELAEGLINKFKITVICTVPSYSGVIEAKYKEKKYYFENINGVDVIRVRVPEFSKANKSSRIKNIVSYAKRSLKATLKVKKVDIVFTISQPPVLGGLLGVFGKFAKHAKFVYNIQDFNPEQIIAVSYSKNKMLLSLMMKLDKFSCKRTDAVITVGRDLVETMNKRFNGKKAPKTIMINNWIDENSIIPLPPDDENVIEFKKEHGLDNKFVVMYSGNVGLYYDLNNIIKVLGRFKDNKDVVFAFVGEGAVLDDLKQYKESKHLENIVFIPYQDKEKVVYSLNSADVHLCVNALGIKGVSCPSKAYGIMAAGKPIIGVLEEGSEIRCIIEESGCGKCCAPAEYEEIYEIIKWYIDNAKNAEMQEMGNKGRIYLERNLSMQTSINKYADVLNTI